MHRVYVSLSVEVLGEELCARPPGREDEHRPLTYAFEILPRVSLPDVQKPEDSRVRTVP